MTPAVSLFLTALQGVGATAAVVNGAAAAAAEVARCCREAGASLAMRWRDPWLEGLGLDAALAGTRCEVLAWDEALGEAALRQTAARAGAGITSAQFAIARTGTVAVASGPGRGRLVSLLPPLHIALVPAAAVYAEQSDFFRALAGRPLPPALNLVTGPSSSGDIENDRVIGVHGPGRVHVIIVAEEDDVPGERSESAWTEHTA